jgi:hypothetical protein
MLFGSADIPLDASHSPQVFGQRRCLIEQYYKSLDMTTVEDARKILKVFEQVLKDLEA